MFRIRKQCFKASGTPIVKETILDEPECLPGLQDMMEAGSKSGNEMNQSRICFLLSPPTSSGYVSLLKNILPLVHAL